MVGWTEYTGQKGDRIPILVFDDAGVVEVVVQICRPGGSELESGVALPSNNCGEWIYTVQQDNRAIEGCMIRVFAMDHPGNQTEYFVRLR